MVANGKVNCVMSPIRRLAAETIFSWREMMEAAFFDKYSEIISDKVCVSSNSECLIWTACTSGEKVKYGVVKVTFSCGNRRTIKAHRLAFMLFHRQTFLAAHLDASHLCHNSLCANANHINLEPRSINSQRNSCKKTGNCSGHGIYPACLLWLQL